MFHLAREFMSRLSLLIVALPLVVAQSATCQERLRFNRDVRPILSEKCFRCHGRDAKARQADLRLDQRKSAVAQRKNAPPAIVPGRPKQSDLIRRITHSDASERMPPATAGSQLTAREVAILRQWIAAGARFERHWAYVPPRRPALPSLTVSGKGWARSPIDHFVLRKLQRRSLRPARRGSPSMLARRVTLDLNGLPPTVAEIDAFERAYRQDPDRAYRSLVNRLLSSPRYGERMAQHWMDVARFADTNGYFTDNERIMWPWRDWVIAAFNRNMPFDQFTIEQLAGDLLPKATLQQRIATGFNRNHTINNETGIIEEEYRVEYVADRVDTTATVWMGLTLRCARCHDHKYDPISQKDFYRFFSFFNQLDERGLSGSGGNSTPLLTVPSRQHQERLALLKRKRDQIEARFAAIRKRLARNESAWRKRMGQSPPSLPAGRPVTYCSFDAPVPDRISRKLPAKAAGICGKAVQFEGYDALALTNRTGIQRRKPFTVAAWIKPSGSGCVVSIMDDVHEMRGFDIVLRKGKAVVNLVHRWNRNAIRVSTRSGISSGKWMHLALTYDGSSRASGLRLYVDGRLQPVSVEKDNLTGAIVNDEPLRLGRRQASNSYRGLIDEFRVYDRELSDREVGRLMVVELLRAKNGPAGAAAVAAKLHAYFVEHVADNDLASVVLRRARLRTAYQKLSRQAPTLMVMRESAKRRATHVLVRGQYNQPGKQVRAGFPTSLQLRRRGKPQVRELNRLDLAKWLVSPRHPLTARVSVNRLWQQFFGTGLVKSVDDFGTQGEWPSHPELLDWLAMELIESGWDTKHVVRQIVLSATYQQTSHATLAAYRSDPDNRLLARGPRFRMDAEMLRDSALRAAGLLVERVGGPSVRPYQPPGLWADVTYDSNESYAADGGASLFRRSLYTFWKRQSPPPAMLAFDAPTRETCVVRRSLTNTPLQALLLMNGKTFVEAARKLAERAVSRKDHDRLRVQYLFRVATSRRPTVDEARVLLQLLKQQRSAFRQHPLDAQRLLSGLLSVGKSPRDASLPKQELAAWTVVAQLVLSLDEAITKP